MGRKYLRNAKMWRRGEFCFHKFCHQLFRGCIATRLLCASSSVSSIKYPKHPSTCGLELSSNCKYSQQRHPISIPPKHQYLILDKKTFKTTNLKWIIEKNKTTQSGKWLLPAQAPKNSICDVKHTHTHRAPKNTHQAPKTHTGPQKGHTGP